MLKKKVIASSISNLTDARYFAGWMVDYIVFDINPESEFYTNPQEIGAFQSWVEGPKYFLELAKDQFDDAEKYLVDLNCQGLIVNFDDRALVANLDVPIILVVRTSQLADENTREIISGISTEIILTDIVDIKNAIQLISDFKEQTQFDKDIYIDVKDFSISEDEILNESYEGLLFHGGPEEKVGYKSFDDIDEIMEVLQDF